MDHGKDQVLEQKGRTIDLDPSMRLSTLPLAMLRLWKLCWQTVQRWMCKAGRPSWALFTQSEMTETPGKWISSEGMAKKNINFELETMQNHPKQQNKNHLFTKSSVFHLFFFHFLAFFFSFSVPKGEETGETPLHLAANDDISRALFAAKASDDIADHLGAKAEITKRSEKMKYKYSFIFFKKKSLKSLF